MKAMEEIKFCSLQTKNKGNSQRSLCFCLSYLADVKKILL
ncbi:hypothetical protein APA_3191 [Pseudanabaena sp. lw0831]|nr:hypothetical protein APA_3191 [Pseudanabaena sp. lw0831]